ncbi:MAG: TraR/DksA C4-type zinc finger protein [Verrucomicrobium sp.]|nr:TraR/DksA C4-type zinc finger protein [Verrucomicrobium sp.]
MATKPSKNTAASEKAGSKAQPEPALAKKSKADGASASSDKKSADSKKVAQAKVKTTASESNGKPAPQPSKKPVASPAPSETATPGTKVPSSVKKTETSSDDKAPAASKPKATEKKASAKADAKPASAAKTKAKAEPKEEAKAGEEVAAAVPAPAPAPAKPKKAAPTPVFTPVLAAVAKPVPPPRIKKPILDSAPEVIIKQAYNPAKLPPFIKKLQQRLIELRSALLDSMDIVAKDSLRNRPEGSEASVGGMHMADAGSDAYDRDFALSMLSKEQDALYEINEALDRVGQGVYGVCELSGEKINDERLEALPYTRYTREMQELIERDQMGGRLRRAPVRSVFGLEEDGEEGEDGEEEDRPSNNNQSESSLDFMKE